MTSVPIADLDLATLPIEDSAFGRGAHQCLGMHLARLQIEDGLHLIAQRIKRPQLSGEIIWRRFPGVWGIKSLPIRFTPAIAKQPARTTVGA